MSIIKISGSKGDYSFDSEISFIRKGKYSTVYVGCDESGKKLLIKKLHADKNEFLLQFNHTAFVAYSDQCISRNEHYLIRPFINGESLYVLSKSGFLRKKSNKNLRINIIQKTGEALTALHSSELIHGDIRPHNIILEYGGDLPEQDAPIRIIDLAMMRKAGTIPSQNGFSLLYSPPELILKQYGLTGFAADQYSFAITMYEILTGVIPFKHFNPELLMHLMLMQSLPSERGISDATLSVLRKASSRYPFKSPPSNLDLEDLQFQLQQAVKNRYETINDFCDALISSLTNKQKSFFSFSNLKYFQVL